MTSIPPPQPHEQPPVVAAEPTAPVLTLSQQAAPYLAKGYFVKLQDRDMMILERPGSEVNHTLHLILTLVTLGMWSIVWLLIAVAKKRPNTVTLYGTNG